MSTTFLLDDYYTVMPVFGYLTYLQLELNDRKKRQEEEYQRQHPDSAIPQKRSYAEQYLAEFLPPPEPEPK